MRVTHRSALTIAALTTLILVLALLGARPAQAASYHCQHRVQDAVWSWTFNKDSYTTGLNPVRHTVKQTAYVTAQVCDNRRAADRFRIKSVTYCLTDPRHSSKHTGATFNAFFHTLETSTKVNLPPRKVTEDGSPEHRCGRQTIARSDQEYETWLSRPVVSVGTTQNLRFPYPDPHADWRTSAGSRDRRMYQSDFARVGVRYWPGY